jgi:hypothetical protein
MFFLELPTEDNVILMNDFKGYGPGLLPDLCQHVQLPFYQIC